MRFVNTLILLFFIFSAIVQQAHGQNLSNEQRRLLEQKINSCVQENGPGLALGIVRNGEVIFEKYAGYANLEHQILIDPQTRFNIASNAKQFTAICVLKLAHERELALTDDIRKHLPELFKETSAKISIAQLLNHSSGIRDVYDLWALQGKTWWQHFFDNSDALELLSKQRDLNFEPGTQHLYSNSNYILLTEIVSRVTGAEFGDYSSRLFKDLGMNNTNFLTNYMSIVPNRARPYGNWGGWKEYPLITSLHGDGALFTTLADQLRWEQVIGVSQQNVIDPKVIAKSQSFEQKSGNASEFGFGLMLGEVNGRPCVFHDGSTGAYNSALLRFPNEQLAVVAMSNSGRVSPHDLVRECANVILGSANTTKASPVFESKEIGPEPLPFEVVGTYNTENGLIQIVHEDGAFVRRMYQRDPVKLIHERGGLFRYESNKDLKIVFSNRQDEKKSFTIYYPGQADNVGVMLPAFSPDDGYFTGLNGMFVNSETETEITIKHNQDDLFLIFTRGEELEAQLVYEDLLSMGSHRIKVGRDSNNRVNGMKVDNDRIKNVHFEKQPKAIDR